WEAMPLVILEALQLGTPIVTTKAGAISDVIEDGKTGLLVERRDTAGMADAIARVLDDRELASRLAATGQAFAGEHSLEHMVEPSPAASPAAIARRGGDSPST